MNRARKLLHLRREEIYDVVPAIELKYMGVAQGLQGKGFGTEIYRDLLETLERSEFIPKFLTLEVWKENWAYDMYLDWGYIDVGAEQALDFRGHRRWIARLVHNRYVRSIAAQ